MLTQLGKELRKLRMDRGLLLKNMADTLGITSSYLSAIEFGKRSVPDGFIRKVTAAFSLTPTEQSALEKHALKNEYKIKASTFDQQELAAGLARRFDKLSADELNRIKAILEEKSDE